MAHEYAVSFYQSRAWKNCRKSFIANRVSIDGGICEVCKKDLGHIVHHKTYITPDNINNPETTLNFNNLAYVCHDCHNKEHFGTKEEEKYFFDSNGMIHELPDLTDKLKEPTF